MIKVRLLTITNSTIITTTTQFLPLPSSNYSTIEPTNNFNQDLTLNNNYSTISKFRYDRYRLIKLQLR